MNLQENWKAFHRSTPSPSPTPLPYSGPPSGRVVPSRYCQPDPVPAHSEPPATWLPKFPFYSPDLGPWYPTSWRSLRVLSHPVQWSSPTEDHLLPSLKGFPPRLREGRRWNKRSLTIRGLQEKSISSSAFHNLPPIHHSSHLTQITSESSQTPTLLKNIYF